MVKGFLEAAGKHVRPRKDKFPGGPEAVGAVAVEREDEEDIWQEVENEMKVEGGDGEVVVEAKTAKDIKAAKKADNHENDEEKLEDAEGRVAEGDENEEIEVGVREGREMGEELWRERVEVKKKDVEGVVRRAPVGPTKEEREAHEALHAEHRGWCRHCIRGRGRNWPHRRTEGEKDAKEAGRVVRVSMDYNFAGEDDGEVGTWITMVESRCGAVWCKWWKSWMRGVTGERTWC